MNVYFLCKGTSTTKQMKKSRKLFLLETFKTSTNSNEKLEGRVAKRGV